jgi:hypothetical protein
MVIYIDVKQQHKLGKKCAFDDMMFFFLSKQKKKKRTLFLLHRFRLL